MRLVVVPVVAIAIGCWSIATLASLHSAASLARGEAFAATGLQTPALPIEASKAKLTAKAALVSLPGVSGQNASRRLAHFAGKAAERQAALQKSFETAAPAPRMIDPFAKAIAKASLSRESMLAAFASAGMEIVDPAPDLPAAEPVKLALAMPAIERFHHMETTNFTAGEVAYGADYAGATVDPYSSYALSRTGKQAGMAFATVEAVAQTPVQLALASLGNDPFGIDANDETVVAIMPDIVDLPPAKPRPARPADPEDSSPARKPAKNAKPVQEAQPQALAYARPDNPVDAAPFKNLFDKPKAGKGVAIYDISAAVVHMPDGTKLEAHSGIGKMADNPRYVHVKMNGPTPPNTYRLSMRESRFYGVEAVRMTPIGKQTMHGRDGILAHSYLLRGGRAESHGCVAFKDYPKFLKAFKQGKVTHIVVVPSMSNAPAVRLASTGRGA